RRGKERRPYLQDYLCIAGRFYAVMASEAKQSSFATAKKAGLLRRGACHRAARCADPLAPRNDRKIGNSLIHRDSLAPFGARLSHFATPRAVPFKPANESGTKGARIADSSRLRLRSPQHEGSWCGRRH